MKRVSFPVAKALKEAGYPQTLEEGYDEGYAITKVRYKQYDRFDATWYTYIAQPETDLIFSNEYHYPENCGEFCVSPICLEVWLWLWQEKDIQITRGIDFCCIWIPDEKGNYVSKATIKKDDPEDAIIASIEYLVTNKLLK